MDVRSIFAAQRYEAQRSSMQPGNATAQGDGVSNAGRAIDSFAETLRQSEKIAQDSMIGSADPHMLVQALSQSELAVETVVAVRNKVVEAYQEILRMPV